MKSCTYEINYESREILVSEIDTCRNINSWAVAHKRTKSLHTSSGR